MNSWVIKIYDPNRALLMEMDLYENEQLCPIPSVKSKIECRFNPHKERYFVSDDDEYPDADIIVSNVSYDLLHRTIKVFTCDAVRWIG